MRKQVSESLLLSSAITPLYFLFLAGALGGYGLLLVASVFMGTSFVLSFCTVAAMAGYRSVQKDDNRTK